MRERNICFGMRRTLLPLSETDRLLHGIDRLIAWIDRSVSRMLTAVLHDPTFQQLESSWRGLGYLVNESGDDPIVEILILSVSKRELDDDLNDAPGIDQCGLFHLTYRQEYDMYGGRPYAAILLDYEISRALEDIRLLDCLAKIGSLVHAPCITATSPCFFGVERFDDLAAIPGISEILSLAEYRKWRVFQSRDYARYMVLMLNRFLVRLPYRAARVGSGRSSLTYDEARWDADGHGYVFTSPVYGMGSILARAFIRDGWCTDIFGLGEGGTLSHVPVGAFEYGYEAGSKPTTEFVITSRLERQLAELGFLPLIHHRTTCQPCVVSSRTVQEMKRFGRDTAAAGNWTISSRLPFVMLVCRLAHYIKVHQRMNLGGLVQPEAVQLELERWLRTELVSTDTSPSLDTRRRYILRNAQVRVEPLPDDPGKLRVELIIQPHYQLENVSVQLDCVTTISVAPAREDSAERSDSNARRLGAA